MVRGGLRTGTPLLEGVRKRSARRREATSAATGVARAESRLVPLSSSTLTMLPKYLLTSPFPCFILPGLRAADTCFQDGWRRPARMRLKLHHSACIHAREESEQLHLHVGKCAHSLQTHRTQVR